MHTSDQSSHIFHCTSSSARLKTCAVISASCEHPQQVDLHLQVIATRNSSDALKTSRFCRLTPPRYHISKCSFQEIASTHWSGFTSDHLPDLLGFLYDDQEDYFSTKSCKCTPTFMYIGPGVLFCGWTQTFWSVFQDFCHVSTNVYFITKYQYYCLLLSQALWCCIFCNNLVRVYVCVCAPCMHSMDANES